MYLKRSSLKIMDIIICSCSRSHIFFNEQGHLVFLKQNERIDCSSLQLTIYIIYTFFTRYKALYHHYIIYILM